MLFADSAVPQTLPPPPPTRPRGTLSSIPKARKVKILDGQEVWVVYRGQDPVPAQGKTAICSRSAPYLEKENDGIRMGWAFVFTPLGAIEKLHSVKTVTVEEVSLTEPVQLFSGAPTIYQEEIAVVPRGDMVTKERYPWLWTEEDTRFIFRLTLEREGEKPDVIIQPVRVTPYVKQLLKQEGFLP